MGESFGPRRHKEAIVLNIYDLTPSNEYLYGVGLGFYHSGLVVYGREWTFGSGGGVFSTAPKEVPNAPFRESIVMGTTKMSPGDVDRAIDSLRDRFKDGEYNLYKKNCNHFSEALAAKLLNIPLPGWVNRMATLGQMFSCIMPPDEDLGQAPVGGGGGSGGGGGGNERFHATSSSSGVATIAPGGRRGAGGRASAGASPFAGKPVRAGGGGASVARGEEAEGGGGMLGGVLGSVFGGGGSSGDARSADGAAAAGGGGAEAAEARRQRRLAALEARSRARGGASAGGSGAAPSSKTD